ncbi:efflux RND transporter periplasmic adaptor subunit [Roseovarius aquimarinus]|uniref:Efflux RND transporter periplasmic adaptor subunit n=1 Tax=Roseovarius aquimarinus TaxID=1229156 RepID=A0ABW7I653_9RHOB
MTYSILRAVPSLLLFAFLAGPLTAQTVQPLTCLLAPLRASEIGTDLRGIVVDTPVSRTQFVKKDDVLIRLDTQMAAAEQAVTEITAAALEEQIQRSERLASSNLIPRDEIEQLRTDLAVAEADLARGALAIERAQIRAPFAGYIAAVMVEEGELIGAEPLVQLIDVSTLRAEMAYVDTAFGALKLGDEVRFSVDLVGAEVTGHVTSIDPFIDASSNTFSVVAEIENSDLALPAGAGCRVIP